VGVLHRLPARGPVDSPEAGCRRVIDAIAAQDGLAARAGIGEPATAVGGLHDSYQDACEALRLGARRPDGLPVHPIGELRVQQLLATVSQSARNRLLASTTAQLRTQPDWPALRDTITAWCESGFNLVRAAAALHIHRNTVVYRMNKIEQLTGRPLRDHHTTMALYLACLTDHLTVTED
ncbi:PucR family transcriptional regulator, partial [Streptomyces sp. NPDC002920]